MENHTSDYRVEKDSIGTKDVPANVYYGVQSLRAAENFPITGLRMNPELIRSLAYIKKAAALTNLEAGLLNERIANAIVRACDEILAGKLREQFIVDPVQGGAGTSTNMNMNEVIANRALELGGHPKGDYGFIHPNDDVNHSQSTNDTYPAACKLALIDAIGPLAEETKKLTRAFHDLADKHTNDVTIGRTQLQDAVPMTYGQEFHAFASFLKSDLLALEHVVPQLTTLNLGATAIGTGICADLRFRTTATRHLAAITGLPITAAADPVAAMTDMSGYIATSQTVKNLAIHLKKAADDLRLLNSGPHTGFDDLNVPARQAGSSIMPGKVNPVIPEVINQVAFLIIGNDMTVTMAAEGGQLELNAFEPIIFYCLFQSIGTLTYAVHTFVDNCVTGITANEERCRELVESSVGVITALTPHIGYQHAADIAKRAIVTGQSVRKLILQEKLLTEEEIDTILDPMNLTKPGIPGKELLAHK